MKIWIPEEKYTKQLVSSLLFIFHVYFIFEIKLHCKFIKTGHLSFVQILMTFSGKAVHNLHLQFLLHFTSQSCFSNGRKIISNTWVCYDYMEVGPISRWWVNERYKRSALDSGLPAVIAWLILSLLKHLRMRSYDVKTPQSFWSGCLYLMTLIGFFFNLYFFCCFSSVLLLSAFFYFYFMFTCTDQTL